MGYYSNVRLITTNQGYNIIKNQIALRNRIRASISDYDLKRQFILKMAKHNQKRYDILTQQAQELYKEMHLDAIKNNNYENSEYIKQFIEALEDVVEECEFDHKTHVIYDDNDDVRSLYHKHPPKDYTKSDLKNLFIFFQENKVLDFSQMVYEDQNFVYLKWDHIKWYDKGEEVVRICKWMAYLEIPYSLVRIGQDQIDIQIEEFLVESSPIPRPEIIRTFDDNKTILELKANI